MLKGSIMAIALCTGGLAGDVDAAEAGTQRAMAVWPHMHQCTLDAVAGFADGDAATQRIDLVIGAPTATGAAPTIAAHAINTKGTGASGRAAADHAINTKGTGAAGRAMSTAPMQDRAVAAACTGMPLPADANARAAALRIFSFATPEGGGPGWTCSVSGSDDEPVFRVALLEPGTAAVAPATARTASWSLGASHPGASIVRHGVEHADSWSVPCASAAGGKPRYDLAIAKVL